MRPNSGPSRSSSSEAPLFEADLLRRYDVRGPRYTSYPTAPQFHAGFSAKDYMETVADTNADPVPAPLSLYVHIPFCRSLCYYCACTKVVTRDPAKSAAYLRRLHLELVRQAALFGGDRPVEQLHWGGGTPSFLAPAEMQALMEAIRERFSLVPEEEGEFSIEVDPRTIGPGDVGKLRGMGFNRMSIGVQDFNPEVQRAINRMQPEQLTRELAAEARARGFRSISLDLIYGLPRQTVSGFARTLERAVDIAPDRLSVFNYAHLPRQFRAQRLIRDSDLPDAAEKIRLLGLTIEVLTGAGYRHIGMDHFARQDDELSVAQREGRLTRNFQGYSTHGGCDLIGLGMSSISQVGDCYSQNAKDLPSYIERVDAGGLAVERGLRLSEEDLVRRRIISGLICSLRVEYGWFESWYRERFWDYFAEERGMLRPMEADALIEIDEGCLRITDRGRLLVRNVCMVFDAYLRQGRRRAAFSRAI
jgi:oxygen-independent coproporphyrinogen-3 oxidase